MEQLRLYTFVIGLYLSDKQKGIQSGHLADQMSADYLLSPVLVSEIRTKEMYAEWLKNHKTYIVLDATNLKGVKGAYTSITTLASALGLPFGKFHEDEDSLGSIMTCCGVVVPERYFSTKKYFAPIDTGGSVEMGYEYTPEEGKRLLFSPGSTEYEFIEFIKSYRLA